MRVLDEYKSDKLVSKYIKVVSSKRYSLKDLETIEVYEPCFLKIMSPNTPHKRKLGAIFRFTNTLELKKQIPKIESIYSKINGEYLIMQDEVKGEEFIIGIKEDSTFGNVIMFGIGGSLAEEIGDVTFRKLPITKSDAKSMVDDIKNYYLIKKVDRKLIEDSLYKIQKITKIKGFRELDINPIKVNCKNAIVVDSKVYLGG